MKKDILFKTALEKKYNKKILISELKTKDIIFFCRDALSYTVSEKDKKIYEREILDLMKSMKLDVSYKSIDGNNLLAYPVYNNAFKIVDYLLENNFYDLQNYNDDVSQDVCACIMLDGEKMMHKLLDLNINEKYINDMCFRAYLMASVVFPDYKKSYEDKVKQLIDKTDFKEILENFIKHDDFSKCVNQYKLFLQDHPMDLKKKIEVVENVLKPLRNKGKIIEVKEKYKLLNIWLNYHILEDNLTRQNDNKNKQIRYKI